MYSVQVLWAIKELDKKWLHLQKRKSALQRYYNKRYEEECCNIVSGARFAFIKELFETTIKSLKKAESERDVDDVDMEFSLHFPPTEGGNDGKYKRPAKKSQYSYCKKAGLWELAHKFGDSKQFGFQITLERTVCSVVYKLLLIPCFCFNICVRHNLASSDCRDLSLMRILRNFQRR